MRKMIATLAVIIAATTLSFGQNNDMVKFFEQIESVNNRMIRAMDEDNKAAMESIYLEVVDIYNQQPGTVKQNATNMMGGIWYNIACLRALQENTPGTLEALTHAMQFGWKDYTHTMNDPDLKSLRDNPDFVKLAESMR